MSDPASAAPSSPEVTCSGGLPATSFEAAGVDLVAGWVVLVVTAIAVALQNGMPDCFLGEISPCVSNPQPNVAIIALPAGGAFDRPLYLLAFSRCGPIISTLSRQLFEQTDLCCVKLSQE